MEHAFVYIPKELEGFEASASDPLTFRKELIYAGSFAKKDQRFTIDRPLLDHYKSTVDKMLSNGIDIPIPIEHTTDPEKNRGKLLGVEVAKNKRGVESLFGTIKFRDEESAKLAKTSNVSIYQPPEFTDGVGRKYVRPIRHVALTDYPVIPALEGFEPIAASFSGESLELMYPPTAQPAATGVPPAAPPAGAPAPAPAPAGSSPIKALAGTLGIAVQPNQDDNAVMQQIVAAFNAMKQKIASAAATPAPAPAPMIPQVPKIAASLVNVVRENRQNRLEALVTRPKPAITPAVRDKLKMIFVTDDAISLSLSDTQEIAALDRFDAVLKALEDNDPITLGEQSRAQSLRLSGSTNPDNDSPVVRNAEKRAKAAQ